VFAFARISDDELVYFEFGEPLDPDVAIEPHLRWILDDFESRKDEFNRLSRSHSVALLVDWLLQPSDDRPAPLTLIRAIGFLRFTSSAPAIEPFLAHESLALKSEAILALGRIGALESLPKIETFLTSPERALRRSAIVALSRSLDSATHDRLEAAAGADPELRQIVRQGRRRLAAVNAQDLRAFTNIVLETDEFEDLLPLIEITLQYIAETATDRGRDPVVRLRALSLMRTTWMRPADRALGAILADDAEVREIRLEAAMTAGPCRARSAVNPLIAMVGSEPLPVKRIAIRSLGQIGSVKALETLLASWQTLDTLRGEIRLAIRRVCKVPSATVADALLANEPWRPQQIWFITADLQLVEGYRAGFVDGELRSAEAMARRDAILLLAYLGTEGERSKIEPLTKDPDPSLRELAIRAMAFRSAPRPG
jgi:HEAT repeat protein